ncbi:MAG: hypothetical protein AAF368_00160 [Planctomycetota bacterium]
MSRIRSIKPEWVDDEALHEAGIVARLMSVSLISMADDYGNGRAHIGQLAGRLFWSEENSRELVANGLEALSRVGFLSLYEVRGQRYYAIRNWKKHQRVDKPGKPKVPGPDEAKTARETHVPEELEKTPETLAKVPETLATEGTRKGWDQEGTAATRARGVPPDVPEPSPSNVNDPPPGDTPAVRWKVFVAAWQDQHGGQGLGLFNDRIGREIDRLRDRFESADAWRAECVAFAASVTDPNELRSVWAVFTGNVGRWQVRSMSTGRGMARVSPAAERGEPTPVGSAFAHLDDDFEPEQGVA